MKEIAFKNLTEKFQYESAIAGIKTVAFGNLFLLLLILVGNSGKIGLFSIGTFCLISGAFILIVHNFYNWTRPKINLLVLILYVIILAVELQLLGIPAPLIEPGKFHGKGTLLYMAMYLVPFIYIGIRIALILPLMIMYYRALKLDRSK